MAQTVIEKSPNDLTPVKKEPKANLKYLRDKHREPVKGIFRFHEVPGGSMSFVFRAYKQDPVERFDLVDGETYTIPLGVALHLNKNGWYPKYEFMKDEKSHNIQRISGKVRRFSFQSLEFVDIEDMTPNGKPLYTVETI